MQKYAKYALCVSIALTAHSAFANLLVNGDFQDGLPSETPLASLLGWTVSGNVFLRPWSDNQYIAFNYSDSAPTGRIEQTIATAPGQQYTLVFSSKVATYVWFDQILNVSVTGLNPILDVSIGDINADSNYAPSAYDTYSYTFMADATYTKIAFSDVASNDTLATDILLDNVAVMAVPEPSTFVLLALGGIGLMVHVGRNRRS